MGLGAREAACQTAEQRASSKVPGPWCEPGSLWPGGGWFHLTLSLPFQLLKRCEGTVTLDQVRGNFDITCNNVSGPFLYCGNCCGGGGGLWNFLWTNDPLPHPGQRKALLSAPFLPEPQVSSPGCVSLEQWFSWGPHPENLSARQIRSPTQTT